MIRVLTLVILCVSLGSCTPIIDKVSDSACIPPGIPCDQSGQACCPGYQCIQTSVNEKAYCVQTERPPFIMARAGFFSGPPPQFMGMNTMPTDILPRDANAEGETCKQFTHCDLSAPECCGDLICRGTNTEDAYCVVKPKPEEYGTKKNCGIEGDNGHQCISPEECCEGYYCQKYPSNTRYTPRCLPVDLSFRLAYTRALDARSMHFREEVTSCQSSLDCQPGYDCSQQGKCFPAAASDHPTVFAPHEKTVSIKARGENIVCQSYRDCPDDYRCSHGKEGTWDGVCMPSGEHHGWLVNRGNSKIVQKEKEKKEFEFPEFPTTWCTQEGCPCYISSPCEMGICDSYDERMIGKCRKFRPGEGDDLQPGFPIDTGSTSMGDVGGSTLMDGCFIHDKSLMQSAELRTVPAAGKVNAWRAPAQTTMRTGLADARLDKAVQTAAI
ncbi:hypothetical protein EV426DRAFT_578229 [Tirmania nivea]|nr:hypothetical protein EV426DRAFT_578229 [Tirmania nivea]